MSPFYIRVRDQLGIKGTSVLFLYLVGPLLVAIVSGIIPPATILKNRLALDPPVHDMVQSTGASVRYLKSMPGSYQNSVFR